ncbi:MAG: hypothetical protein JWQ25_513 [Daejeonella sp.]|nr:hypothetical protein [Daejeonella sp.]
MQDTINKIENAFKVVQQLFSQTSEEEAEFKATPQKWSKKEILGHLCDSAINNLQRFTEVQYESKPYNVRKYKQDELVRANNYQQIPIEQTLNLWLALNKQIISLIKYQTIKTLNFEIITGNYDLQSLKWLMEDYAIHMEHHIQQIRKVS